MGAQCFDFPTRPSCAARGLYARTLACAPTFVESIGLGAALLAPAVTRVARRLFFFFVPSLFQSKTKGHQSTGTTMEHLCSQVRRPRTRMCELAWSVAFLSVRVCVSLSPDDKEILM